MTLPFFKYQGTGNDFVMIDDRENRFDATNQQLIAKLCDRRFGIGADGLILLRLHPEFDFEMVYFNADGNPSSMCGNGGRCTVRFAHHLGLFDTHTTFLAVDGPHEAFLKDGLVHLKMVDVSKVEQNESYCFLNTGSPHYIQFVDDVSKFPVVEQGRKIRHSETFQPNGTNVNFVEIRGNELFVRTFERGVEDETYSFGTGVTAAAIAASLQIPSSHFAIKTLGGNLQVAFQKGNEGYEEVYLIGPAERVFVGSVEI